MRLFNTNKKADVQISLSWVFMIVIGTFFIYVAYSVIGTYSENEETKYYIQVKSAISNVLSKAGQTIGYEENYIQPIETFFEDSQVEIICNDGIPLLSLNEKIDDNVDFLKNVPTFMTIINEGKVAKTFIAVENFRAPFKVINMMGIISSKNMIVFDSQSEITEVLREKFSDSSYRDSLSFSEVNFDIIDSDEYNTLINKGDYQSIIFVSDDDRILNFNLDELIRDEVYHLRVSGSPSDFKYGELNYLDKLGDETKFSYVDFRDDVFDSKPISMITMGVFSRPSTYQCGQELVVEFTEDIFNFYIEKTKYLITVAENQQVCSSDLAYSSGGVFDGTFQVDLYKKIEDKLIEGRNLIQNDKFNKHGELYQIIEDIQRISEDLSDNSCEMIY